MIAFPLSLIHILYGEVCNLKMAKERLMLCYSGAGKIRAAYSYQVVMKSKVVEEYENNITGN